MSHRTTLIITAMLFATTVSAQEHLQKKALDSMEPSMGVRIIHVADLP